MNRKIQTGVKCNTEILSVQLNAKMTSTKAETCHFHVIRRTKNAQMLTVWTVFLPQTPAEGASITVYAAAASEMEGVGGCYLYNGQKTQSSDSSYDSELQVELWKKSCELVGLQAAHH